MAVEDADVAQEMIRQRTLVKQAAAAGPERRGEEIEHRTSKRVVEGGGHCRGPFGFGLMTRSCLFTALDSNRTSHTMHQED
ncbi:msl0131 [Mesorhizobium japonicum MAFF 303099]|uniref:Msl0131 protein n=1 Tax=Mesorhizobium japonicum (strain LMG 29417 / CECT 9101 / MAFF 303099) TaxID=266835 RepID=Q98NI1_RHILO|nr:msl0131 [Mesorhizobium japonicum MAFF 303099]